MAGYVVNMNDMGALASCIESGVYSTILSEPKNGKWRRSQEGTFADYFTMKPGDHIYFFNDRKIYGIGKIIDVNADCKYLNYIGADEPKIFSDEEYIGRKPLLTLADADNRCFCTFVPNPYFFLNGIDMDDALNSDPDRFRMLRAMWKVSFIKVDDEEDKALLNIILKRNEEALYRGNNVFTYSEKKHKYIAKNASDLYRMSAYRLLMSCLNNKDNKIQHEMAIEAALCDILSNDKNTIFGEWDYISHQVVASPFKAIDYMDKMDMFGYRYIKGYDTISKYMTIEIKKDVADISVIEQVMKYVDWIQGEYVHGDYSMIEAFVVAADFPEEVIRLRDEKCVRYFTKGFRPSTSCIWRGVRLIRYEYVEGNLQFIEV